MKDSIIQLDDGNNYYIIEEINYKNRNFILGALCDIEKDKVIDKKFYLMERKIINNEEIIDEIKDDVLAQEVADIILKKL